MRWRCIFIVIFSFVLTTNNYSLADSDALVGKIQRNQFDGGPGTATTNCPKQTDYAASIKQRLGSFAFSPMLTGNTQNATLQAGAQNTTLQGNAQNTNLKLNAQNALLPGGAQTANNRKALTIKDVLANHDLAIIVDRSGSMATKDCPGGLSRWQWCSKQAQSLAQAAAEASSSVTMYFFNADLQVFDNVKPSNIPALFDCYSPSGGTILSAPITAQLDRYFTSRSKPLIIVVISDGIPEDTQVLAPMIADASDSLRYEGEVTVSVLLIGKQMDAVEFRKLLGIIDNGTIKSGGMVDVVNYNTLCAKGIKQTLFEELKTITSTTNRYKPSKAEHFALGKSLLTSTSSNPFPAYEAHSITNQFPTASLTAAKAYAKSK